MKKHEDEIMIEVEDDNDAADSVEVEEQPKKKSWWKYALTAVGGAVAGAIVTGLCVSRDNETGSDDDGEYLMLDVDASDIPDDVSMTEF